MTSERELPTPANWHWAITPDDVDKIKAINYETLNRVYFANLDTFTRMAKNFCYYRSVQYSLWRDCVNQIYVDLPCYNYTNVQTFAKGLKRSFYSAVYTTCSPYSTISLNISIDDEDGRTLEDIIIAKPITEDLEIKENEKLVLECIAKQSKLTETQQDTLVAYAFKCSLYKGIFKYEYDRLNSES